MKKKERLKLIITATYLSGKERQLLVNCPEFEYQIRYLFLLLRLKLVRGLFCDLKFWDLCKCVDHLRGFFLMKSSIFNYVT